MPLLPNSGGRSRWICVSLRPAKVTYSDPVSRNWINTEIKFQSSSNDITVKCELVLLTPSSSNDDLWDSKYISNHLGHMFGLSSDQLMTYIYPIYSNLSFAMWHTTSAQVSCICPLSSPLVNTAVPALFYPRVLNPFCLWISHLLFYPFL